MKQSIIAIFTICTFLIITLSSNQAIAQQITGNWYNATYGTTMIMDKLNNYALYSNQNVMTESGKYSIQDNFLYLQNEQNGFTFVYQILSLTESTLICFDNNSGIQFNFTKSQEPEITNNSPTNISGAVLMEKDGITLLQGHINIYVKLMEFVVGQSISTSDKADIQKSCKEGFSINPNDQIADAINVHQSMQQLYTLTDIGQISAGRMLFISEFHKNWEQIQSTIIGQLLEKYAPIDAFDTNSGLALTRQDLDGFIAFIDFMNSEVSQGVPMTNDQKINYKKQIKLQFSMLPIEQQTSICMGNMLNLIMKENWNKMNDSQKSLVRQQLLQQPSYQNNIQDQGTIYDDSWLSGFEETNWKPSDKLTALKEKVNAGKATELDFANYQAELDAQNMFFNTMHNMNLQSHVTSLNIIENMGGGSGNYWEVVDY